MALTFKTGRGWLLGSELEDIGSLNVLTMLDFPRDVLPMPNSSGPDPAPERGAQLPPISLVEAEGGVGDRVRDMLGPRMDSGVVARWAIPPKLSLEIFQAS